MATPAPPKGTPVAKPYENPKRFGDSSLHTPNNLNTLTPEARKEILATHGHVPSPDEFYPSQEFDYYCGSQVQLFINEVLIDECTYVGYNKVANKSPIYSYSGRRWATTALGNIEVSGRFGVNFKDAGYLFIIQAFLESRRKMTETSVSRPGLLNLGEDHRDLELRAQRIESVLHASNNPNIGFRNPGDHRRTAFLNALKTIDETRFNELAADFEKVVWTTSDADDIRDKLGDYGLKTSPDEFPAFDIYLVFGDPEDATRNFTVKRIREVELVGSTMEFGADGNAVQEHYSFIARDVL